MEIDVEILDGLDEAVVLLGAKPNSPKWLRHIHNQLVAYSRTATKLYNQGECGETVVANVKSGLIRQLDESRLNSAVRAKMVDVIDMCSTLLED